MKKNSVRSVYFEVVERENLDKVIAEVKSAPKAAQAKTAGDRLKDAEYLLINGLMKSEYIGRFGASGAYKFRNCSCDGLETVNVMPLNVRPQSFVALSK
ncbi:MAG: CsgG/HfaB family protein [Turneriella sp.]